MAGDGLPTELGRGSCMAHATHEWALLSDVLLPSAGEAGKRRIRISRHNLPTTPARAWPCASRPEMEIWLLAERHDSRRARPTSCSLRCSAWRRGRAEEGREPSERGGGARLRV